MIIGLKGIKGENNLLILTIYDGKRRSMDLTTLGATNLLVSRIGIGLAALGRPGYINIGHANDLEQNYAVAAMEARAHAVLDAAIVTFAAAYNARGLLANNQFKKCIL